MWLKLGLSQLTTSCACDGRVTVLGGVNMCGPLLKENRTPSFGVFNRKTLAAFYNAFNGMCLVLKSVF